MTAVRLLFGVFLLLEECHHAFERFILKTRDRIKSVSKRLPAYLVDWIPAHERRWLVEKAFRRMRPYPHRWKLRWRDLVITRLLGLRVEETTRAFNSHSKEEIYGKYGDELVWHGYPSEGGATPYGQLEAVFRKLPLKEGELFVDLGSGFGQVGFHLAFKYPGVRFIGYEIVKEKVDEARRVGLELEFSDRIRFFEQDLSEENFILPEADYYFAFNPFSLATWNKILDQLRRINLQSDRRFCLVSTRDPLGILHRPWLKRIPEQGFPYFWFYESKKSRTQGIEWAASTRKVTANASLLRPPSFKNEVFV